jgi:hypothetical protein
MHFPGRALVLVICSSIPAFAAAQQPPTSTPQRDAQAVAVLSQSISIMGRVPPTDSVATGTVTIVAGSSTNTGTVRILTRGTDQTSEEIQTSQPLKKVVYSRGMASEVVGVTVRPLNMELVVTSQSPDFPLALLSGAVNDSATALQYVALENVNGAQAHHIRIWKSFAASPSLQHLAEFSAKDSWIDATTSLPRKLSFYRRSALGASPRIPVEISFSDYRNVSGLFYPFLIKKSFNGTPWTTIAIQSVAFNTGLVESDFPIH